MFRKKVPIHWIEVNAKIVDSIISSTSWGTEVNHAQNNSQRRVKLTVEFLFNEKQSIRATGKFWAYTKNRNFFQTGSFVTILYNEAKPTQFKLKYRI